jgi:hypothetical protein
MPEYTDTKSYAAFKDGYNAGIARDEQAKDRAVSRANDALYDDCKKYNKRSSKNINYFSPPIIKKVGTEDLFILYKNDVEFSNSFREQVLQDERNYFEKKYSKAVYRYLLDKRAKFNDDTDATFLLDLSSCPICSTTCTKVSGGVNDKCESTFKTLYDKLTQYYPYISSDTTYRKIEYRDTEHQFLMSINSFINIIYYVLLFIMVILLASSNRLLIKERFLVYLLLILLPFLYPYIFDLCKTIFNSLFISKPIHGPKNAFVELPPPNIDAFDI